MLVKTLAKGLRFVIFSAFVPLTAMNLWSETRGTKNQGGNRGDTEESARVTISVYNNAELSVDMVGRAEDQAERVFRQAGIAVTWLNCRIPADSEEASRACREAVFPEHLHLRIVRRSAGLNADAMGVSFQAEDGSGCYADLFYEPMEKLHQSDGTDIASLLGHVAAHEIGHLLLGKNSHSAAGIMHAHWTANELASVKAGGMVFSEEEAQRMREKLVATPQATTQGPLPVAKALSARTGE